MEKKINKEESIVILDEGIDENDIMEILRFCCTSTYFPYRLL